MWAAKSSPYSKSNSSWPLFSAGQRGDDSHCCMASRRIAAPNSSSTRMPALSFAHAGFQRRDEAIVDDLLCSPRSPRFCRRVSVAVQTEHVGLEGAAMIERQDVERLVMSERHRHFPLQSGDSAGSRRWSSCRARVRFVFAVQFGNDALRQHLAQLDAPLVEGVDLPDRALREHAVLVQRDQRAEHCRRQLFGEDVLVGRLPSKVRCGTSASGVPSARTSSAVLPNASASLCANRLAISRS